MRTQSRRAPLLAACAFALAASLSARADETAAVTSAPTLQATVPLATGSLNTPEGQRMAAELAELERALIKHMKGEQPSTFEALDERRKTLKVRLEGMTLPQSDKKVLNDRLGRSESVIIRCLRLTGGGPMLNAELAKAVGNAGAVPNPAAAQDPLFQIDALLGELDRASANPADAEKIFDDLNRRYGTPKGPAGGVPVNFGAIRKTLAETWSYTPKGAPGTNAAKARNLSRDTPAPIQVLDVRAESYDYAAALSLSAGRAANEFSAKLPDGVERRFVTERDARLKELFDSGRRAAAVMGVDPNTFTTIDALVAFLSKKEQELADSFGLSNTYETMDEVVSRIKKIMTSNQELGGFMAALWEYRGFLRTNLVAAMVPVNTKFTPWETFPDGAGTSGAQVVGLSRGISEFVGLRYDNPDGSSRFQGQARNGRSGLIVAIDKAKNRTESLISYSADAQLESALTEIYDGAKLSRRERLNMSTGEVEITEYKANGTVLKSTKKNTKTGEQFIRDLSSSDNRFEATTRDGRREIKFLPNAGGAPPAVSLRIEKVGTDGTFELERMVLQNGTHIVAKSAHVTQLLEAGKKNLGWEVALKSLVDSTDGKKRLTIGQALAHETVVALGMNDANGRMSKPMGAFLAAEAKDTGDLIDPKHGAPIRFFINENKNYLLIFTRRDGTKRILSGTFKQATEFEDRQGLGTAFGVSGEIEIDKAGNARQADAKIVTEYLADGSRLVWLQPSPVKYTPETSLGWFGKHEMWWTNEHEKTEFKVRRDIPPDLNRAEWNPDGRQWVSHKDTIDREISGTSVFGTGSRWVASVPGVKQVLGVCGDVASTLYTGIVSGGQVIAYGVSGNEDFILEATAGYSRNPGMKLLMGGSEPDRDKDPKAWRAWKDKMNSEFLSRAGGEDSRMVLDVQARERREKALAEQGITERRAPQAYRDAMKAPISDDERYDALSDFGAGTYGRRLAADGHTILGGAMSFGESLGEGLLNPLMYVIPGIGGAAAKTVQWTATRGATMQVVGKVAEFGLRGFQYALLGSVVGSFSLSALDNIGKVADYWGTPEASVKAGEALADLAFGGLMIRGFTQERTRSQLADLKNLSAAPKGAEISPVSVEATVRAAEVAVKADVAVKVADVAVRTIDPTIKVEAPAGGAKVEVTAEAAVVGNGAKTGLVTRMTNSVSSIFTELMRKGGDAFKEPVREELRSGDVKAPTQGAANGPSGTAALEAKAVEIKTAEARPTEIKPLEAVAAAVSAPSIKTAVEVKAAPEVKAVEAKAEVRAAPEVKVTEAKAAGEVRVAEVKTEARAVEVKTEAKAVEVKTEAKAAEVKTEAKAAEVKGEKKGELKEETAKKENLKDEKRGRTELREEGRAAAREEARAKVREEARPEAKVEVELKDKPGRFRRMTEWVGEKAERGSRWIEKRPIMNLARGTVILPLTPAMKRNMAEPDADRNRNARKDPPPPEKKDNEEVEEAPAPEPAPREETPQDEGPRTTAPAQAPATTIQAQQEPPPNNETGGFSGGSRGSDGGAADGGAPSGNGPKPPKFGGFGGGGGGGGPAGNGADGGGGAESGDAASPGAGPSGSAPAVSAAAPANLFGGAPVIPVNRGPQAVPNDTSAGGHTPSPSLASRFDGSRKQPNTATTWSPSAMKGVGAGDSPGLPRLAARAGALSAPAAPGDAAPVAQTAGGSVASPQPMTAGARPEEEDFSYTYMAPARHKYELPSDNPSDAKDWSALLSLVLRGAAALSIGYLIYRSDLPYLVGFTRRRRDGTYGA